MLSHPNVLFSRKRVSLYAITDLIILTVTLLALLGLFPRAVLDASTPATGGDTGSHYWTLYCLLHDGLKTGNLHIWSPGNLAGEPILVHYFPFPFMVMAFLSRFMRLEIAFNIGTVLPIIALPLSAYFFIRSLRFHFPAAALSAVASYVFLLNDSYSAWGGNIKSTLSGQFAHLYALNLLLFGASVFYRELCKRRMPYLSGLLFGLVALSHGYVMLGIPVFVLTIIFAVEDIPWTTRLLNIMVAAGLAFCVSAWWLIPMLDNAKWTTPYADQWLHWIGSKEYAPLAFAPLMIFGMLGFPLNEVVYGPVESQLKLWLKRLFVILVPGVFFLAMVWIFPRIGLVDIRALPQVHLMICLVGAVAYSFGVAKIKCPYNAIIAFVSMVALLWMANGSANEIKNWAVWNYSGWSAKPAYKNLLVLSDTIHGDFSMPRVIFEHNDRNNEAGTTRVFEMLPYFTGRATTESLYMQATITAPEVFALQALVSKTPSCPFKDYRCVSYDLAAVIPKLKLFGIGDVILQTDELLNQAKRSNDLVSVARHGFWHVYSLRVKPNYAEVLLRKPTAISSANWRQDFYEWFLNYNGTQNLMTVAGYLPDTLRPLWQKHSGNSAEDVWSGQAGCHPVVKPAMNALHLTTSCPGKAHLLKFSYNGALRANTGDALFMLSPGFIGIIPSQNEVEIDFGKKFTWWISAWLSALCLAGLFLVMCFTIFNRYIYKLK
ncbi:MAG: 6-pyruvoyl-tetrahydropterin synthase-related protein [Methylococcales bacterium]